MIGRCINKYFVLLLLFYFTAWTIYERIYFFFMSKFVFCIGTLLNRKYEDFKTYFRQKYFYLLEISDTFIINIKFTTSITCKTYKKYVKVS